MKAVCLFFLLFLPLCSFSETYTRQDTLRGSNGRGRAWWDVQHYDLSVRFDTAKRSISGTNTILFRVVSAPADSLQIDLQDGMFLDEVTWEGRSLDFSKEGNVFWIRYPFSGWRVNTTASLRLAYHGRPHEAKHAPWDGGLIWTKDSLGKPWIAVACQHFGASCWWPCKDFQGDEPDSGMRIDLRVPAGLQAISNGKARCNTIASAAGSDSSCPYFIQNPINSYDVTFYIGDYAHWQDTLMGERGLLTLDFYPLRYNEQKARQQFAVTRQMLHCFEYWMGPYPFYEDGYKLVEAPYLGMEHQSAVAYGNQYKMGYLGQDRSKTGIGLRFDFIIVHESGHEWFGNNITARDIADNWLHEGFTTYTEGLFAECLAGKDSAFQYIRGEWDNIRNDRPVTGDYGVNNEGSSDMYDKGAAVVHMIRGIMNDDERFRQLLRGLNRDFYHRIVTGDSMEAYISKAAGRDLRPLFDQYLRTVNIPVLEYYTRGKSLHYRFANVVPDFRLPLTANASGRQYRLNFTDRWQVVKLKTPPDELTFSPDFLYRMRYVIDDL